jgi:hypothetical protein
MDDDDYDDDDNDNDDDNNNDNNNKRGNWNHDTIIHKIPEQRTGEARNQETI